MASPPVRIVGCLFVGLFAGVPLGVLFVPDPTGLVAFALAAVCTALVTGALYRSDWLRA